MRQLNNSPEKEQWLAADQLAIDVILADPRNKLVPKHIVLSQSLPISQCVTQRKVVLDPNRPGIIYFPELDAGEDALCKKQKAEQVSVGGCFWLSIRNIKPNEIA